NPLTNVWKVFPIGYCPDNCINGLPNAIFIDAKNMVWFSEHIAGRIARYDPLTGVLTEYWVPGSSIPLMWWAMPGPNNLVWFVPYSTSITIFAAWNATLGQRYVALTAFNSQVSLDVFVRVNVVDSSVSYVTVGFASMIVLGSLAIFVRRPRKRKSNSVGRMRK